jgi:hypothetical protein
MPAPAPDHHELTSQPADSFALGASGVVTVREYGFSPRRTHRSLSTGFEASSFTSGRKFGPNAWSDGV